MSTSPASNFSTSAPIEIFDKIFCFLDSSSLFWNIARVCKAWRARPLVLTAISIYMKEGKDCLSEGYPLDLINSLFKHSISICRLPVMPTINIQCGAHYGWLISTRDMVNPMTGKPTSLMRFKQPNDHEFGLLMRIKCHALIKFKELEPIIPRDLPRSEYEYCMYPVNSYPEYNVFETGTSPPDTDEHTPGRILFLTINELNRSTTISSNHWTSDKHTFMNYAYKLKGIDKQISQEKNLSQCVEEMLVGDGLFQIYSPPDQISPPPNTT